jgi:aspartate ammonia-lyase
MGLIMKELKVLIGFEKLKDKTILLYNVDYDVFITYDREVLIFEKEYDSNYLGYSNKEEINECIVHNKNLRDLLIANDVIDEEYYQSLLQEIENKKILRQEEERQRKINQYNRLKAELNL